MITDQEVKWFKEVDVFGGAEGVLIQKEDFLVSFFVAKELRLHQFEHHLFYQVILIYLTIFLLRRRFTYMLFCHNSVLNSTENPLSDILKVNFLFSSLTDIFV